MHENYPNSDSKVFTTDYSSSELLGLPTIHDQAMRSWLRPYQDDDFLVQRLTQEGRILRNNPEVIADVVEGLEGDDNESLLKAVASLNKARVDRQPASTSPAVALIDYATLAHNIAYQKNLIDETAQLDGQMPLHFWSAES